MYNFDEKDKFAVLKFFKKLYLKSVDNISVNPFDMSDEQDKEAAKKSATLIKPHPLKTKKSLYQMVPVDEDRNQYISSHLQFNHSVAASNHAALSKSLRSNYRAPSDSDIPDIPKLTTQNKSVFEWKRSAPDASPSPSNNKSEDDNNLLNSEHD